MTRPLLLLFYFSRSRLPTWLGCCMWVWRIKTSVLHRLSHVSEYTVQYICTYVLLLSSNVSDRQSGNPACCPHFCPHPSVRAAGFTAAMTSVERMGPDGVRTKCIGQPRLSSISRISSFCCRRNNNRFKGSLLFLLYRAVKDSHYKNP